MLVLSRKQNERIRIGENIELLVVSVKGGKVRLGITAPLEIPVHREEVLAQLLGDVSADPTDRSATMETCPAGSG